MKYRSLFMLIEIIFTSLVGLVAATLSGDTVLIPLMMIFGVLIAIWTVLAEIAERLAENAISKPGVAGPDEIALHEKGIKPDYANPDKQHNRCRGTGLVKDDKGQVVFCACMYAQT